MDHIYKTDDWRLRDSIYKAFGGKCFYTGQKVRKEDMVIDHVVPKSLGGEDSVYNYVLTTKSINSQKSTRVDIDGVEPILYLIRIIYAPKVLRSIKRLASESNKTDGNRITIYLPAGVHEKMKEAAWRLRKSLSGYLVDLHRDSLACADSVKDAQPDKFESHKPKPPKKSDPAGGKQDVIDSLKEQVDKIPGKKVDPYFRPMEKKGSKKGGKK